MDNGVKRPRQPPQATEEEQQRWARAHDDAWRIEQAKTVAQRAEQAAQEAAAWRVAREQQKTQKAQQKAEQKAEHKAEREKALKALKPQFCTRCLAVPRPRSIKTLPNGAMFHMATADVYYRGGVRARTVCGGKIYQVGKNTHIDRRTEPAPAICQNRADNGLLCGFACEKTDTEGVWVHPVIPAWFCTRSLVSSRGGDLSDQYVIALRGITQPSQVTPLCDVCGGLLVRTKTGFCHARTVPCAQTRWPVGT